MRFVVIIQADGRKAVTRARFPSNAQARKFRIYGERQSLTDRGTSRWREHQESGSDSFWTFQSVSLLVRGLCCASTKLCHALRET
jgi:hypothetical protein